MVSSLNKLTQVSHNIKTSDGGNDQPNTVQYSAGKPLILVFMWMPLVTNWPLKYPYRSSTLPVA